MDALIEPMRRLLLLATLLGSTIAATNAIAPSANADEIWMSEGRTIQWIDSRGSTAVFKMQTAVGDNVYLYIEGLASDVSGNRGSYAGYWVNSNRRRKCFTSRGFQRKSYNWGNIVINFIGNSFPYSWTARYGQCDGRLDQSMRAVPMMQAN